MKKLYILFITVLCILTFSCIREASKYVEEVNIAMEHGDYQKAYNIYDEMVANNPYRGSMQTEKEEEYDRACNDLKEKIIKNELAETIEDSEGASNVAKIVYIIEEKGNNDSQYYEYASKIARAAGNTQLAEGLSEVVQGN